MLDHILERIDQRLSALNMSAGAASLKAGLSRDAIRNIQRAVEAGREGVSTTTLLSLAPVLETSAAWLLDGSGESSRIRVPLISWVSAGQFAQSEAVMETDDFPTIEIAGLPDGDWSALEVIGDSMDRISPPGSTIVVNRRNKRLTHNACYVASDGEGGATYKRFRQSPARLEPVSTNPIHEPIFLPDNYSPNVFGRVCRSFIDM